VTALRLDPRVAGGMEEQLALRRARVEAGEHPIGWKVGFGTPEAMARFGTDRPLVGFLTDAALLADGAEVSLAGWTAPALEPELAVHLARDIRPHDSREQARAAIAGVSAAIELADVDPPPSDPQTILAGNIFNRHVVLGQLREARTDGAGVSARVTRDGEEVARTDDIHAMPGDPIEILCLTAELLAACGESLSAGDVVITGSVVPPLTVAPGDRIAVELGPLGGLSLSFNTTA
jgi:2-keto-4-pentenoate hydratase